MKRFLPLLLLLLVQLSSAQNYTRQDSLRGSITPERNWWNLLHYHLDIEVVPNQKYLSGKNTIQYQVNRPHQLMQIDLQEPLQIDKVLQNGKELSFYREGSAYFISLKKKQRKNKTEKIEIYYSGHPHQAKNAPWDGGVVFTQDKNGNPFIATACQGIGASIWWPNKDHPYDEPDQGMLISVRVPENLVTVSNGRLLNTEHHNDGTHTWHWQVKSPINNYGVNINIGDYEHFGETYFGEKGPLDMDFWVLRDNLEKAKEQFKDARRTLEALEHWFGPYPFYEDSYKLVEVPYLGMEHQSSVTYGNNYKNGYLGRDLSGSGWGLKFDFIIIHESAHEWFANNITNLDVADMWLHEGFTCYAESLFVEYFYGKEAGAAYVTGVAKNIRNDRPLIADYHVNQRGSGDIYYKGANILHTLRQLIEDDELWRDVLRGLNQEFFHQTVSSKQVENYISQKTNKDLTVFFDQYLRTADIPQIDIFVTENSLRFKYVNTVAGFDMPLKIYVNENTRWVFPKSDTWVEIHSEEVIQYVEIDSNFLVQPNFNPNQ